MWIQRSTMLSPPGHNTLHIHEHNQLTQYTSNVFSFFLILQYDTTHSQTGEQKEGCLKKSTIQIKLMWRRNQCKVMDPAVVCHGNFLETPGPPKPLQAQPRVFVWFALKAFHSPFQKKEPNNSRLLLIPPGYWFHIHVHYAWMSMDAVNQCKTE